MVALFRVIRGGGRPCWCKNDIEEALAGVEEEVESVGAAEVALAVDELRKLEELQECAENAFDER